LHRSYWKRFHDHANPNRAKLELFAVARRAEALAQLDKIAVQEFTTLWEEHKSDIQKLAASEKARFLALMQASGNPVQHQWELPDDIVEKVDGEEWHNHLYTNAEGVFFAKFNGWEREFLEQAMKEEGFVGWLRNLSRRSWALCIPYELGGTKAFFPDFVIVRRKKSGFEVDLLEPHNATRADTWAKAKGLAAFADQHGVEFGRLVIARKKGDRFQTLDVNDKATRQKARSMQSQNDLESLFGT
jgi:type III restriction enzyme